MNNLIIIAHPDKKSFCHNGIFKTIEKTLNSNKEKVHVIDLYQENINFNFGEDKDVFDVIINTDNLTANQVIDVTTETVRKLL